MARIIFILGGCRSGKSKFALQEALKLSGKHIFLATCPRIDRELEDRIMRHQEQRNSIIWKTIEEQIEIEKIFINLSDGSSKVIVLDCISLWINNLLYQAEQTSNILTESMIRELCQKILDATVNIKGTLFIVSNEVGLGLVPQTTIGRVYRDLLGTANQIIAQTADDVTFLISGIPINIKEKRIQDFKL